jgi:hypothetical protein
VPRSAGYLPDAGVLCPAPAEPGRGRPSCTGCELSASGLTTVTQRLRLKHLAIHLTRLRTPPEPGARSWRFGSSMPAFEGPGAVRGRLLRGRCWQSVFMLLSTGAVHRVFIPAPTWHPPQCCAAVHVGPGARILFGAVLTAEDGEVRVGAQLRGRSRRNSQASPGRRRTESLGQIVTPLDTSGPHGCRSGLDEERPAAADPVGLTGETRDG